MIPLGLVLAETAGFLIGIVVLSASREAPPARVRTVVAAIALAAAAIAVAASGEPTGWIVLDAAFRAAGAVGVVLLGARADTRAVAVTTSVALAAAYGADIQYVAILATGLAVAALLLGRDSQVLNALMGGVAAQVALRLQHGSPRGLSALLAVAVVAPVVATGARHLEAPVRRMLVRGALALAAVGVVGTMAGGAAAVLARSSLQAGVDVVGGGRVGTEGVSAAVRFDAAGRSFGDARATLDGWWARPAGLVPVVAQHWRLLRSVAVSGQELSAAAVRAAADGGISDLKISGGRVPLERISTMGPVLDDTVAQLAAANRRLAAADSPWLLPPLRDRLDRELGDLVAAESAARGLARALPELPAMLGADGPRRYFLAVQTPAELRATGGFMGSYGEITADKGQLKLEKFGRKGDLNFNLPYEGAVITANPDYLARYARFHPESEWASVNVSPDFPTVAGVMAEMYPQSGGKPIDGVIAVDPGGLAALLKLVGPITVEGWPEPITADNAVKVLLLDQYTRFGYFERVDFLGAVAQQAWGRLTTGSLPSPQEFLPSLGPAVRNKHIMLSAVRPVEDALFREAGMSGAMAPVNGDFLGVITQNAGGSKVDAFLRREVDYDVKLNPAKGTLSAVARIVLRNDSPATGLPDPVIGNLIGLPPGTNRLYMSVYTPWALDRATVGGAPVVTESATELGRMVYSMVVDIAPGASATVELRLTGAWSHPPAAGYELDVHRQPTTAPDDLHTTLTVASGWRVGNGGARWSEHQPMESDRTIKLPLGRERLFGL